VEKTSILDVLRTPAGAGARRQNLPMSVAGKYESDPITHALEADDWGRASIGCAHDADHRSAVSLFSRSYCA